MLMHARVIKALVGSLSRGAMNKTRQLRRLASGENFDYADIRETFPLGCSFSCRAP